ncbi:MAG: 16S rRNA (guanine(966)-N(2))-methyltransferase RsmD [Lachnospiraceae bacterium]|nr:16S rRNA (guanine(966)-N(2))-methyltransferase RsmD [Lachnospiraceae bacterium]
MRVIAGTARSVPLVCPRGLNTRPTGDQIKETLFNIISPDIPGARFLDLFAGSGAIGIEALSRGAESAVFVDKSREANKCICANLEKTRLGGSAQVLLMDVYAALNELEHKGMQFDIIFMDPPYDMEIEKEVFQALSRSRIVSKDTMIIAEASAQTDFSYLEEEGFTLLREKKYKTNKHVFAVRSAEQ